MLEMDLQQRYYDDGSWSLLMHYKMADSDDAKFAMLLDALKYRFVKHRCVFVEGLTLLYLYAFHTLEGCDLGWIHVSSDNVHDV